MSLPVLLVFMAMMAAAGRILFYRRNGAQFHRRFSVLAWVVVVCLITSALGLSLGWYREIPGGIDVLILLLCLRIWRDKGNVARLFGGARW